MIAKFCKTLMVISGLLSICIYTYAQQNTEKLISGQYKDLKIEQFVKSLELQSGYHFYYDEAQFSSLSITMQVQEKPLSAVLKQLFNNTAFHYFIDAQRNSVFLTAGYEILATLPPGLTENSKGSTSAGNLPFAVYNYSDDKEPVASRAILESKIYEIGIKTSSIKPGNATLTGLITNLKTSLPVAGASVFIDNPHITATTNQYGYYNISMPAGPHILNIKHTGMDDARRQIMVFSDGRLNIGLNEKVLALKEVVISSQKLANVTRTQLGVEKLDIKTIKQVPTVFGETDILRVVLTLPGVKSAGEASTGFTVRGGATDQNLILFNDATIFNPAHFFGFFSAFNPDIIKDVELYKSSIPAQYGGRISSILDISTREGNKQKFAGTAGIGLLTSRLNIEGPLVKDKTSFILGGRTTYSNWLLKLLPDKSGYKNSKASFSDLNLNLSHKVNDKNTLYFTGYYSRDLSNLNSDTLYGYSNKTASLKWRHIFNNKFTGAFTTGYDQYQYNNRSDKDSPDSYKLNFDINQATFKADLSYALGSSNSLDFGLSSLYYKIHPGSLNPKGNQSRIVPDLVEAEQAVESALYLSDRYDISSRFSVNLGLRFSLYNYLGPKTVYTYLANSPKEEVNITDTLAYGSGAGVKTYLGPEYRVSARYSITDDFSVKAGYNTMRQYIHMLSNTTAISPTDIWKLSDPNIKPQYGDQLSLGLYKNFKSNTIEVSVEGYYKRLKDYLDYKSGASLVLNHHIETDVINTRGKAYGVELMIKKMSGKLNGWMSYTYSRTLLKMDDLNAGELINNGAYYPGNYDRPSDFTLIGNYRFSSRFSISVNNTWSTGRPITLPIARYVYAGAERVLYSERNKYRVPDYFRTDFSMNIEGNHKIHQFSHSSWTIGVYNLTGRKNAYSTYFTTENGAVNGYKLSVFASPVPFINYNVRF